MLSPHSPSSVEPRTRRRIDTCFVPFDERNPYQRALAAHLRVLGVHVTSRNSLEAVIPRIVRSAESPNLIHLHWLPRFYPDLRGGRRLLKFWLRLLLLRLLGRRVVWTVHNLYAHEGVCRWMERWLARRVIASAARVIVHSETARRLVVEEFGCQDREKIVVVPHGNYVGCYPNTISGEDARARLRLDPQSVVVLFLGNIRPYKGVSELIEAYQQLASSSSSLVIAGRPPNQSVVSELERKILNNQRIQLRPEFIPDEEVQHYLNASDVVVFPYQDILTSGAVILAMSFGRACIAPALGCIPDVLDERGAFLYDPRQPDGLRAAMEQAIQDRARLKAMGAHNRERAEEWGWDRIARETVAVYAAALGLRDSASAF